MTRRLYADENVNLRIVHFLRGAGHDVLRALEAGNANRGVPDESVLDYAWRERRTILTGDRNDYVRLHRAGASHAGIVVFTSRHLPVSTAERIDAALRDERAQGRFLARVDGVGHRFDP